MKNLITVEGMSVRAGDHTIAPTLHLPMVAIELAMKTHNGGELRVPMSVTKLHLPAENTAITFEHTGGSCTMRVNSENSNHELSVEFTEKNADAPVAR